MRRILAAAALFGAISASAAPFYEGALPAPSPAARAMPQKPPAGASYEVEAGVLGAPAVSVDLAPLLDNVRTTQASFRSGGTVVHVFGDKSQNKKEWFVGFAPEDGSDARYRKGKKMLHWVMINRTVKFEIGPRKYSAWVEGKITDRMNSRLVVEPEDKTEPRSSWTIGELSKAAFEAGTPVTVGGRDFRLLYSRNFNEDAKSGEFGGWSGDRSIVLMFKDGDKFAGYHWFEREIPRGPVLVTSPRTAQEDDSYAAGSLKLGLRLMGSVLELFIPR